MKLQDIEQEILLLDKPKIIPHPKSNTNSKNNHVTHKYLAICFKGRVYLKGDRIQYINQQQNTNNHKSNYDSKSDSKPDNSNSKSNSKPNKSNSKSKSKITSQSELKLEHDDKSVSRRLDRKFEEEVDEREN